MGPSQLPGISLLVGPVLGQALGVDSTRPTSLTLSHVCVQSVPSQRMCLRLSVPSSMFAPIPAVGKVMLRARPLPLLVWRLFPFVQAPLPCRQGAIALCLRLYLAQHCSMVADCLTKRMRSDRLSGCLRSCWLDLIPTDVSVLCKMKKQKGRTNPDGSAGDLDRNDHFDQWRSYMKELPAE